MIGFIDYFPLWVAKQKTLNAISVIRSSLQPELPTFASSHTQSYKYMYTYTYLYTELGTVVPSYCQSS